MAPRQRNRADGRHGEVVHPPIVRGTLQREDVGKLGRENKLLEVVDPTEDEFRELLQIMSDILQIEHNEEAVGFLVERYREEDPAFQHPGYKTQACGNTLC